MGIPPKNTMVCVTVQRTCERLIREGASLCQGEALSVVHVVKNGAPVLGGNSDSDALNYLFQIAREYGAEMDMIRSDDVVGAIAGLVKKNQTAYLVIGAAKEPSHDGIAGQLRAKLPDVQVFVIP